VFQLTYVYHSGFVLEAERCILVFDLWMDFAGAMDRFLESDKPMYVFCSHFHQDHFSPKIFKWKEKKTNITYLLSKDILKHKRAKSEDAHAWLAKGATWADSNIHVTATGSNDSGVSWVIDVDGKRIFHAGDLCNWYARFLADNTTPETILGDELQDVNPVDEEKRFLGELKDIKKVTDSFDLVMFPVDGRIGNGYTLGGRQFIDRFKVGLFVPMHFVLSGFESAWRMEPFCTEKHVAFWCIKEEGETLSLNN